MKPDKKYTHDEHVEMAKRFCAINDELYKLFFDLQGRYGKTSKMCKKLNTIIKDFSIAVRSELDEEYHKVTSNSDFVKKGHVYYNSKYCM